MQHKFLSVFIIVLLAASVKPCYSADRPDFLSQDVVNYYGLTRTWYSQITIDGRVTSIEHTLLDRDIFFVITSNSDMIALDAETGKTLWSRRISNSGVKPLAPATNTRTVALICGHEVHVFDRRNGRLLWHEVLPAAPTSACQLTDYYLYVPLVDQRMACYPMKELKAPSPGLEELVKKYENIGYTLNPYTGKVTKTSNQTVNTEEFILSQKGEKKPAPSQRLKKLVPQYAKIGMILDPYTGEVRDANGQVASWWQENMTETYMPLQGKKELDVLLEEELTRLKSMQRQEQSARLLTDDKNQGDLEDINAPYYLKPQSSPPLFCYSFGIAQAQPIISYDSAETEVLTWFSDRGYLFFAQGSRSKRSEDRDFTLQFRVAVTPVVSYLKTSKIGHFEGSISRDISFQPVVVQKDMEDDSSRFLTIVASASGLVFAYDSITAETRWWQSIGSPAANRLLVVQNKIFIPCLDGNLYCLDSEHGDIRWTSQEIDSLIAASPDWVYAKNIFGDLVAVNPDNGAQKTLFSLKPYKDVYYNNNNDRIYLISSSGLIQCLHENRAELEQPARHTYPPEVYLEYSETDKKPRSKTDGTEQLRQTLPIGASKTPQSSPGTVQPEVTPFGSGDDDFGTDNMFEDTTPTPVTPTTPDDNSGTETFDFDDFDF